MITHSGLCVECGCPVNTVKAHRQSQRCKGFQSLNETVQYKCRKCGDIFDKLGLFKDHVCFVPVTNEIVVPSYESSSSVTTGSSVNVVLVGGTSGTTVNSHPREVESPIQFDEDKSNERLNAVKKDLQLAIKAIENGTDTEKGENPWYILGHLLLDVIGSVEYEKQYLSILTSLRPLLKRIDTNLSVRSTFMTGINDAVCNKSHLQYLYYSMGFYEEMTDNVCKFGCVNELMTLQELVSTFTPSYFMRPIKEWINDYLVAPKRYAYVFDHFYRHEQAEAINDLQPGTSGTQPGTSSAQPGTNGTTSVLATQDRWTIDPFMFQLTELLSQHILDVGIPLFKKVYKRVYSNNDYYRGWKSSDVMKRFVNLYSLIDISAQVFDLNHILRKSIKEHSRFVITPISEAQMIPLKYNDQYHLMSTRISLGIPGYDPVNTLDLLFDNVPEDASKTYAGMYLQGIKVYSSEYKVFQRYKEQVQKEKLSFSGGSVK
jgi:hypothetical protein